MNEMAWKALSVLLAVIGLAVAVFAVYMLRFSQQPEATTGMFGSCAIAAFCFLGALIAWDRDKL